MKKLKFILFFVVLTAIYFAGTTSGYSQNSSDSENRPLVVVNGYFLRYGDLAKIKENLIESRVELNADESSNVFGSRGENGAIVIILKNKQMSAGGNKVSESDLQKLEEIAEAKRKQKENREKERIEYQEKIQEIEESKKNEKQESVKITPPPLTIEQREKSAEESFKKDFPEEIRNMLQNEYIKSVNDPAIKKIIVDGKEVSKTEALKISVFDIDTSTSIYNKEKTEGTLEIRMIKK
ncbi:hypothetical protein [Myroides indicus]|uniref:Uncharacterized protein n=1 Tax=Myroides indicus TaxID=1323422 RepID=A0A4R7ELZ3_9FLAO|nr:hypothetical protein [Myroides indicus]TDS51450.1 hypothetical protein C8P70_1378 [Myroides indicus]